MIFNPKLCPPHTRDAIQNYVKFGYRPGSFLTAVLSNDLRTAIATADDLNIQALPHIVTYCYNEIPSNSWGSPEAVEAWLETPRAELVRD